MRRFLISLLSISMLGGLVSSASASGLNNSQQQQQQQQTRSLGTKLAAKLARQAVRKAQSDDAARRLRTQQRRQDLEQHERIKAMPRPEFAKRVSASDPSGIHNISTQSWANRHRSGFFKERVIVSTHGVRPGQALYERLGGHQQMSLLSIIGGSRSGSGAVSSIKSRLTRRAPVQGPVFGFRTNYRSVGEPSYEGSLFASLTRH